MVPSDSGKVVWWSQAGEKMVELESCLQDYIVSMDWSVSGNGFWMCGFSCLAYFTVERDEKGENQP